MLLDADHAVKNTTGEDRVKRGPIKRSAGAIGEAFDARFPGFGAVTCKVMKFFGTQGMPFANLFIAMPILRIPQRSLCQMMQQS